MSSDGRLDTLSDEELMVRYSRQGDLAAFEVLVYRHERPLLNYIVRAL